MALGYNRPDDIPITLSTVMQNIIDDKTLDVSQGIIHHREGVDLLPSNIELSGFEVRLINAMSRERVLKTYVNEVKKNYDYVLIDCMPSLGMITINALAAADSVIIPTQPHYLSAKGLELLLRSVSMVKRQINPKLRIDGTVTVSSNRIPAAFNGFRIAQISDLHNAVFGEDNAELLQILSECEPNIIVITGDLVDAEHTDIDVALDFAKEAVQIADTYYVTGNHEASLSQYDELKAELENTGVVVLEDKAMQLEYNGDDITLIGLSDPSFTLKGDMFGEVPAMVDTKLRGLIGDKDNYTILLSHRPELFEAYVNCGVDLVLSGHAHGGQFRLPFIGGLVAPNQGLFPKYDAGLYMAEEHEKR